MPAKRTESAQKAASFLQKNRFTAKDQRLLAPYVSNTQGVVFALTNLPEVIKGALFSRYSRTRLGLRELLLREFIQGEDARFADIAGRRLKEDAQVLAVAHAQDFYDRILDGYGDDSIGELGGAHLAIEGISMIATKVLQDARIGGSPLEKSTRYVSFAEKQDGDFLFYKDPEVIASSHGAAYLALNRALFETYGALQEPMLRFIQAHTPRPAGVDPAAYRRSVQARTLDALRGLLPASTLTNMGIFGNGRFFETLLIKLRLAELAELRNLAEAMNTELTKVIPSFIRRAHPRHRHFVGFQDHAQALHAEQTRLVAGLPASAEEPSSVPMVQLVDWDPHAEEKALAALLFAQSDRGLIQLRAWAGGLPTVEKEAIFSRQAELRCNRRHKLPRAFESIFYTFDLVGDFGMYRDLHRHRMLTQERQPLSTRWGYTMPEEVAQAGLTERYAEMMVQAAQCHEALCPDFPAQAQYVVPMAYRIRWYMQINLRALAWLVELRSSPQGHPAYRQLAQQLYREVERLHPRLARLMCFVDLQHYPLGRLGAEQRQDQKSGQKTKKS